MRRISVQPRGTKALSWIMAAVAGLVVLASCGDEITTRPAAEEGYFPLHLRNTWTYDVVEDDLTLSETWTIIDRPVVRLGGETVEGYALERRSTLERSMETLLIRDGQVVSLGGTGSGTALYRYPKEAIPTGVKTGLVDPSGVEVPLKLHAVASVEVGSDLIERQTARYEDCVEIRAAVPGVIESREVVCRGVGVVRGSRIDVLKGTTRTWTLVFFELRI